MSKGSGDEFAAILEGVDDVDDLDSVGQCISDCFDEPFVGTEGSPEVDCSIGFGLVTDDMLRWLDDDEVRDRVFELADVAMYESKTKDRNWVVEHLDAT